MDRIKVTLSQADMVQGGKAMAAVNLERNPQDKTTPELSPSADHTNDTADHQSSAGPTTQ